MTLEPTYHATKVVGNETNNEIGQRNEHLLSAYYVLGIM